MKKQNLIACLFAFVYGLSHAQPGMPFVPGCELPFQSIAVKHSIDDGCGIKGKGTSKNAAANELQNAAKNNFCATGTIKMVSVMSLRELHQRVKANGITFGNYQAVPADRSGLQRLGEGTRVSLTGYIKVERSPHTGDGEGVSCKHPDAENNDIHIELAYRKDEVNKCKRISAEISPHFRPNDLNLDKLKAVKNSLLKVRFTGQFIFVVSHTSSADNPDVHNESSW